MTSSLGAVADRATAPFDAARRGLLALLCRHPAVARWIVDRDRRVAAHASVGVLAALAWTLLAPAAAFVLAPLAFGVPHVASDVRYLVLRRRLPKTVTLLVTVGSAALVAMTALELMGLASRSAALVELALAWGLVAALSLVGALRSRAPLRSLSVLATVAALALSSLAHPTVARVAFAHLHNVVALVVWLLLFRRSRRAALGSLLLVAAAAALIVARRYAVPVFGLSAFGLHLYAIADTMAPGMGPDAALTLTLLFVFLQALHYSIWLGLVPQEDLRAEGTLSFRMSLRSIVHDLGTLGLAAVVVAWMAIVASSFANVHLARAAYLGLATFHGWLELAMLAYFVARGGALPMTSAAAPGPSAVAA